MITTTLTDRTLTVVCRGEIDQRQWLSKLDEHGLTGVMFDHVDYTVALDADGVEVHHWRMRFAADNTTLRAS